MKRSILALLATAASLPLLASASTASAPSTRSVRGDDLQAFSGRWLYVEDRTEGRPTEEQGPPMMVTFGLAHREGCRLSWSAPGTAKSASRSTARPSRPRRPERDTIRPPLAAAWKDGVLEYVIGGT